MGASSEDRQPPQSTLLVAALQALWERHGAEVRSEDGDLLAVVVSMMLAQATSKANSRQAFGRLVDRFDGDWGRIAAAPPEDVIDEIAVGGLARQKGPRIQQLLVETKEAFGVYELEDLRTWTPEAALAWLVARPGIGPATARFALMDAAGMDLMPINGGIRRCLTRLGVLDDPITDREMHRIVAEWVPQGKAYPAHMALVRHARRTCTASRPKCETCAAARLCVYARVGQGRGEPGSKK